MFTRFRFGKPAQAVFPEHSPNKNKGPQKLKLIEYVISFWTCRLTLVCIGNKTSFVFQQTCQSWGENVLETAENVKRANTFVVGYLYFPTSIIMSEISQQTRAFFDSCILYNSFELDNLPSVSLNERNELEKKYAVFVEKLQSCHERTMSRRRFETENSPKQDCRLASSNEFKKMVGYPV